MRDKLISCYVNAAGAILFVTGLAKVLSAGGSARALNLPDPILLLSNRHVLLSVGILELVIAGIALFRRNRFLQVSLIAWLATNFLVYRFGLWWIGAKRPCGCLGTITDALNISPKTVESLMKLILVFLLVGSYAALMSLWLNNGKKPDKASAPVPGESAAV